MIRSPAGEFVLAGELDFTGTARFEIRRRLGAGGMGVVYEAFDRERKTAVALKTLRALDEHSLYRFKNEFRALADLRHPNLVRLGELYCEADQWFFTMELIPGVPFLNYVWTRPPPGMASPEADTLRSKDFGRERRGGRRFDESKLRAALGQLAAGVAAIHATGKIHRDIKPSNVMVTAEGRTVLLDFGLITDMRGGRQNTDVSVVGTAAYMAPEQGAAQAVGPAADWYGVGAMLYEALTGRPPFDGAAIDVLVAKQQTEPPPSRSFDPSVPADLDALCSELLRRDPRGRPSGVEVLSRLRSQPAPTATPRGPAAPFVGREAEKTELRRAFDDSRAGHGVLTFVHGESGVGKSALVRRFLDGIEHDGVVLAGRCYEREEVPFKAFDGIVDALSRYLAHLDPVVAALLLPRDAALLARVFPVLRRVPAMGEVIESKIKVPNPQEVRTRAFAALRELLSRLSERSPLVLFVDDFQWADADSLALLRDLMHPPDPPTLFMVATVRTTPAAQATTQALSTELAEVRHVRLSPLPPDESRQLVELLLPGSTGAAAIAAEAAGHPLFIQELVHAASEGAHAPGSLRLEEALWARIARLEAQPRALLETIAVAGAPLPQRLIAQAAGMGEGDYTEFLAQLRSAHLVRTDGARGTDAVEPYHDRIREAVLAHLDAGSRKNLHAGLAHALEAAGVGEHDPRALVRHFEGAGQPLRAAQLAERAARLAAEALAFERAAELLGSALRLGEHDEAEKRALFMQMGIALANAGRGAEAAEVYLAAANGADAAARLECRRLAAEQLLLSGHLERGMQTLADVLSEIGEVLPPTPARALMSLVWRRIKLRLRGLRFTPHDESEIPARELMRLEVYKAVGFGLAFVDYVRGADYQIRALMLALQTGERRRLARAIHAEAVYYGSQGGRKLVRSKQLMDEAVKIGETVGGPYLKAWARTSSGIRLYFAGEYRKAVEELRIGERVMRDETTGTAWELTSVRIFLMFAFRHLGTFGELRRSYQEYVRDAARRSDRYAETTLIRVCNLVWLAQGDVDGARRDLERSTWEAPGGGFLHLQHWFELRALCEIDLYTGANGLRPGFNELFHSLLMQIQTIRTESRWLLARLHLVRREVAAASRLARKLDRDKMGFTEVWALLLRAGIDATSGHREKAIERLRAAVVAADKMDMGLCAAAARRRLAALTGDAQLMAESDAWMSKENIADPARMTQIVAPGFDPS
jgi:tRNA A-37 threonylcarbamoyl transferase component Bud32